MMSRQRQPHQQMMSKGAIFSNGGLQRQNQFDNFMVKRQPVNFTRNRSLDLIPRKRNTVKPFTTQQKLPYGVLTPFQVPQPNNVVRPFQVSKKLWNQRSRSAGKLYRGHAQRGQAYYLQPQASQTLVSHPNPLHVLSRA